MPSRLSLSAPERQLYSKLRQLLNEPGLLRGNLVEMRRSCGKKNCACRTDPGCRHSSLYLGVSVNGKRRMIYIPSEWEQRVRQWTARYGELREVLERISMKWLERLEKRKE